MIEQGTTGDGIAQFLAMGGYGFYVWSSYAAFLLALLWDGLAPRLRERRLLREIDRRRQRETTRQQARQQVHPPGTDSPGSMP